MRRLQASKRVCASWAGIPSIYDSHSEEQANGIVLKTDKSIEIDSVVSYGNDKIAGLLGWYYKVIQYD